MDFQFFWCTVCHLSINGNQRRYSSRLSIPMFIGAPCTLTTVKLTEGWPNLKCHCIKKDLILKIQWKWKIFYCYYLEERKNEQSKYYCCTKSGWCKASWKPSILKTMYCPIHALIFKPCLVVGWIEGWV